MLNQVAHLVSVAYVDLRLPPTWLCGLNMNVTSRMFGCMCVISYIDGLVQGIRNSVANALELRLSCTNPSIWWRKICTRSVFCCCLVPISQRTHDVIKTSLWGQNDVVSTSQWRCYCVICPWGILQDNFAGTGSIVSLAITIASLKQPWKLLIDKLHEPTSCPFWTLIPPWINNYIHLKLWDEITYPFQNFNGYTVEVWEWISNSVPHFTGHVITFPWWV